MNGFELFPVLSIGIMLVSLFLVQRLRAWLRSWRMIKKGKHAYVTGNPRGIEGLAILFSYLLLFVGLVLSVGVLLISLLVISGNVGLASLLLNMGSNAAYTESAPFGYTYISPYSNYALARINGGSIEAIIAAIILVIAAALIQLAVMRMQPLIKGGSKQ
ncbi:MAG: hypothetical protein ACP5NY_00025 [Thermocladium sp.]